MNPSRHSTVITLSFVEKHENKGKYWRKIAEININENTLIFFI